MFVAPCILSIYGGNETALPIICPELAYGTNNACTNTIFDLVHVYVRVIFSSFFCFFLFSFIFFDDPLFLLFSFLAFALKY